MAAREMISQLTKDEWDAINILGKAFLECQDPEEYEARMLLVGAIRYIRHGMKHTKMGAKRKTSTRWRKQQQQKQGENLWS